MLRTDSESSFPGVRLHDVYLSEACLLALCVRLNDPVAGVSVSYSTLQKALNEGWFESESVSQTRGFPRVRLREVVPMLVPVFGAYVCMCVCVCMYLCTCECVCLFVLCVLCVC
jgi:hypothetical protein